MKNIIKSALLVVMSLALMTACSDDNDSNPTLTSATEFKLNTPALENTPIDLANSSKIILTCSQPNYGFPASTQYTVQVATKQDMSDAVELDESHTSAKIELDAATLASTLTDIYVQQGKTEADFPMDIKAYFRVKAQVVTSTGAAVEGTEIMSNIVSLNKIHLLFSLPPVTTPDNVYVIGKFCGWDWGKCLDMIKVNGAENVFWRLVYIDGEGIKINTDKSWNGKDLGYSGIKISGDCKDDLTDNGGNIASKNPGWYLMIVTTSVSGRDIIYDVQFNKPEVWLTGGVLNGVWDELNPAGLFTVPTTQDGEFVSPAFLAGVSGGKTSDDPGVRAYVKIPGYDWWKSEFIIYDGKIAYRSTGGDQTPRVAGKVGQQLHLNFAKGTGEIK